MSMTGEFRRITGWQLDDLLEQVRHDPEAFAVYLYPPVRRFEPPDPTLSIGKAWHGVHFLLNRHPDEITCGAGRAVFGGKAAGADLSCGPVRYMTPRQVREVASALQSVAEAEFKSGFSPALFRAADIYTGGDWNQPSALGWLWESFVRLREFYREAAHYGDAMLLRLA